MESNAGEVKRLKNRIALLKAENAELRLKNLDLKKISAATSDLRRRLQRHDDLLTAIIDAVPVMIIICDPEVDNFGINREFSNLTGWTGDDIQKKDILELCCPDRWYRKEVKNFMKSADTGWRDLQFTAKDGSIVESSWAHVQLKDRRQVAVGIDIRQRKATEEDRERTQRLIEMQGEKILTILNSIADEVWHCAPGGSMEILNPAALRGIGLEPGEWAVLKEGPGALEILNPDGTLRHVEDTPLLRSLRGEECKGPEMTRHRKTGELRFRQYHSSPVRDRQGDIIGAVCVVTDITDRKRLEERLERNIAELASANMDLESFFHSISHDLRNSLNIMLAMGGVLEEFYIDRLDADGRKCVAEIQASVDKMARTIDGLLRLSRVARQELTIRRINLSDIVAKVVEDLRRAAQTAPPEVVIEPNLYAAADDDLMAIVFSNLIGNAWKFAASVENPRLVIGSTVRNNRQTFFVQDNGIGFDPLDAEKLFVPFARLHADRGFEGYGLGMTIVERIIRRHGGVIWAEGEVGKGATFYFTLPNR